MTPRVGIELEVLTLETVAGVEPPITEKVARLTISAHTVNIAPPLVVGRRDPRPVEVVSEPSAAAGAFLVEPRRGRTLVVDKYRCEDATSQPEAALVARRAARSEEVEEGHRSW